MILPLPANVQAERRHPTVAKRLELIEKRQHWLKTWGHPLPDRRLQSEIEIKRKGER